MGMGHVQSLLILILIFLCYQGSSVRTKDKIYVNIKGQKACFRRLNATSQIGCSSESKGNIGVVHYMRTTKDHDWVLNLGPYPPYVILIAAENFNRQNIAELIDSKRVNGILVIEANSTAQLPPGGFSSDKSCPNDGYGLYYNNTVYKSCKTVEWNHPGEGQMFVDYSIPIFLLTNSSEVQYIIEQCYEKYNNPDDGLASHFPLCAAELKDAMNGAKDSITCIRRSNHFTSLTTSMNQYCDPLGDKNVFGFVNPKNKHEEQQNKSVIIAACRLDYMTLFENVNRSADNPVTSIVALLAAAEAIGKVKEEITDNKTILFTFFQGEAFDYIGSSRMVYDMETGTFLKNEDKYGLHALNLNHLSHFIEVSQLGYQQTNGAKVWLHSDPVSRINISKQIEHLVDQIQRIAQQLNVSVQEPSHSQPLPPSSSQRFLRKTLLPTVVFANHEKEFTNIYYNSMFDIGQLIGVDYPSSGDPDDIPITDQALLLTNISTMLARTLYQLATNKSGSHIQANSTTVSHLLYCYILNSNCPMFHMILREEISHKFHKIPEMNLYVSVKNNNNPLTYITERMLAYFLGDKLENVSKSDCKTMTNGTKRAYWMQGIGKSRQGFCLVAVTRNSDAVSPAFIIDDYDWLSGEYSTWTESIWLQNAMSVRLFLVPSNKLQAVTLFVGVLILCLAMGIVFFLNSRAEVVFSAAPVCPFFDG